MPPERVAPVPFEIFPLTIVQNGVEYRDGVDTTTAEIYARVEGGEPVPSTSAVNLADYAARFSLLSKEYDAVIHIGISSGLSSCFQNAKLAARAFPNVYVLDSQSLTCGHMILILEARKRILAGMEPAQIAAEVQALAGRVTMEFMLDQLTYLRMGGRCSGLAVLGANLLQLKPVIAVGADGKLSMVRKYRGTYEKCLPRFFGDMTKKREEMASGSLILVSTGCPEEWVQQSASLLTELTGQEDIPHYIAGCTIGSHSGPRTLGAAFLRKL
jgi:DegV family protein with EDD domain